MSIQDEGGKIDLNAAPDELLRGLFLSVGLDEDASAASELNAASSPTAKSDGRESPSTRRRA